MIKLENHKDGPSWKDAPEWANFVAQDQDNTWWWYQVKPEYDGYGSWNQSEPWDHESECEIVILPLDAESTLEKRP